MKRNMIIYRKALRNMFGSLKVGQECTNDLFLREQCISGHHRER